MRTMLKSKLHRALVTQADVNYEGSITIDSRLMEAANIVPYEQVHVLDVDNGARLVTYAIEGERDSGIISINGAAARLVYQGHRVIIITYDIVPEDKLPSYQPTLVYLGEGNQITRIGHSNKEAVTSLRPFDGLRASQAQGTAGR